MSTVNASQRRVDKSSIDDGDEKAVMMSESGPKDNDEAQPKVAKDARMMMEINRSCAHRPNVIDTRFYNLIIR